MERDCDEGLKIIAPEEMTFLFELNNTECHQKLTGICSLERKHPDRTQDLGDECDYDYCPSLLRSLRRYGPNRYGNLFTVTIINYRCGHYGFNDGQHRVCIAKKKRLKLPAIIVKLPDEDCELCQNLPCEDGELR
jgi:hypothetical protein